MKYITFAVPCYNSSAYMDKCLSSLLKAGEDAEIIIVDDGSVKDDTAEKADRYAEKYPNIIRTIHQENKGHGGAVNTGIKNATGKYFKVVDSDDWVEETALNELMKTIKGFGEDDAPDAVVVNYVYEHVEDNTRKIVRYKSEFPVGRPFGFSESRSFALGKFLAMHSLIYKTELIKSINLELPEHTFYVDNIFVYKPLPYVNKFYYLNVDFYRYFIGRADQSVSEKNLMARIDQHLKVAEEVMDSYDLNSIKKTKKKLYNYMLDFLAIMVTITSIYLIKIGTPESMEKKAALWARFKKVDEKSYRKCKSKLIGLTASTKKSTCNLCKMIYKVARGIFKFN